MRILEKVPVGQNEPSLFKFDPNAAPFDVVVTECVSNYLLDRSPEAASFSDLSTLHQRITERQLSGVYDAIYDLFLSLKFIKAYDGLCTEIVSEFFDGRAAYQTVPSVRIQMPGQISVNYHTDEWYGHGREVQNFWLPLVTVGGANSMFVADETSSREVTQSIRDGRKSIVEMNELCP